MTTYKQTAESIAAFIANPNAMAVAKLPIREMVTKCIPGEKYFCTDTGQWSVAKDGESMITREYPDGTKDTYKNTKGKDYLFENGKTWQGLKHGESAYGKLKDEYDRYAMLALPGDTVVAVWDETQRVLRPNAYVTAIYVDNPFDISGDKKWVSRQFVLNNNPEDIHPIDIKQKDKNGKPMIVCTASLTAPVAVRESEFNAYIQRFYGGKVPEHLLPVIRNINAEKASNMSHMMGKSDNGLGK